MVSKIIAAITGVIAAMYGLAEWFGIEIWRVLYEWLAPVLQAGVATLISVIPTSPDSITPGVIEIFGYVNYYVPLGEAILMMGTLLTFTAAFVAIKIIIKLIPGGVG